MSYGIHATGARARSLLAGCLAPTLLLALLAAGTAGAQPFPFVDADGDGVADALDNCWQHANPGQADSDADGLGNRCDPDFDGNGVVNFGDLAALRQAFLGTDPAFDLTGDGVVNFGDLAVLRSFFLSAPGPGKWVPVAGPSCAQARAEARNECCPGYDTDGPRLSSVSIPTDCDCSDEPCEPTAFAKQACIPRASWGGPDVQCPDPARIADSQGSGGDADCMAAIDDAKQACGLSVDQHLDLTGEIEGSQITTLPFCESLVEWSQDFTCDPFRIEFVGLTTAEQQAVKDAFGHSPGQAFWREAPYNPSPPDPAIPLAFPFASPTDANEPVSLIRLEIPGNLVRYHAARAGIAPTFAQMEQELEGVECRPDELLCRFDLLDMKDFSDQLEEGSSGTGDGVRYFVDETPSGYTIDKIRFKASDSQSLQVTAEYTGTVEISSEGDLVLDLANDAYLGFLPLHDPRGQNGYATSVPWPASEASYLDRALVVFDIEDFECQGLGGEEGPNGEFLNFRYYTFSTPYFCSCNPADPEQAWCVSDPYPRPFRQLSERNGSGALWEPQDFQNAKVHTVYCSSRDPLDKLPTTLNPPPLVANGLPHPLPPDFASTVVTAEVTLEDLAIRYGLDGSSRAQLTEQVNEFGCSSQYANRRAVGSLASITLNDITMQVGPRVASAVGVEAAVQAPMPGLRVEVTPGVLLIDFELGNLAERWLEDEWWTFPLGWLTQWFLEVFSNIASLLSTILINFVSPVSTVEFGDIQLLMHGMISHRSVIQPSGTFALVTPEVTLGVRRVAMNLPDVDVTPLELLPQWSSPSCDLTNAEDFVDWALNLFLCPLEVATSLARFAATPVLVAIKGTTNLILDAALSPADAIVDQFINNAALIEDENALGSLLAKLTRTQTLLPYHLAPGQDPATAPDSLGVDLSGLTQQQAAQRLSAQLPPPWASLCLGANQASLACFLAKLFVGGGGPSLPQLDIVRMGAKTHYRSMGDIAPGLPISQSDYTAEGLDWDYPPVRYCVGGDRPPGEVNYRTDLLDLDSEQQYLDFEEDELLDDLTTFDDVEVSSLGDPTPTDWRAQCAAFADFKITSRYYIRRIPNPFLAGLFSDVELRVQATKRTNFLLNEVLFCTNDQSCDPTVQNAPIRQRADLALCSMLADMWWRTCDNPNCPGNPPWDNLIRDIASDPFLLGWAQAILNQAAGNASGQLAQELGMLSTRLPQCVADLQAAGYVIPQQVVFTP